MTTFRDASRIDVHHAGSVGREVIKVGALQRIADALEKMTQSSVELRNARDFWKQRADHWQVQAESSARSNRALRAVVTRTKRAEQRLRNAVKDGAR